MINKNNNLKLTYKFFNYKNIELNSFYKFFNFNNKFFKCFNINNNNNFVNVNNKLNNDVIYIKIK